MPLTKEIFPRSTLGMRATGPSALGYNTHKKKMFRSFTFRPSSMLKIASIFTVFCGIYYLDTTTKDEKIRHIV
jgi:hypothetical protein